MGHVCRIKQAAGDYRAAVRIESPLIYSRKSAELERLWHSSIILLAR